MQGYRDIGPFLTLSAAARRRRLDVNSAPAKADHRPGKGLLQPGLLDRRQWPGPSAAEQGFDLAKFRRALVAGPVDRALEQPQADLLGQTGKSPGSKPKREAS